MSQTPRHGEAPRRGRGRARVWIGVALLGAVALGAALKLSGGPQAAPELPSLGRVVDALGGETSPVELAGGLPAVFHVGRARDLAQLLSARMETSMSDVVTIVDVSHLDALARESLSSQLVEAALEDGGALATDLTGATVRALSGPLDGAVRVMLDAGGAVVTRAPLAGPARAVEK